MGKQKNFTSQHFWARGYYASTAGQDEEVIREYIKRHKEIDKKIDQLGLFKQRPPLGGSRRLQKPDNTLPATVVIKRMVEGYAQVLREILDEDS